MIFHVNRNTSIEHACTIETLLETGRMFGHLSKRQPQPSRQLKRVECPIAGLLLNERFERTDQKSPNTRTIALLS